MTATTAETLHHDMQGEHTHTRTRTPHGGSGHSSRESQPTQTHSSTGTILTTQHLLPFILRSSTWASLTHPLSGKEGSPRKPTHLPGTLQAGLQLTGKERKKRTCKGWRGREEPAFSWLPPWSGPASGKNRKETDCHSQVPCQHS